MISFKSQSQQRTWKFTLDGIWHVGANAWVGVTTALLKMVVLMGSAKCCFRAARGPRPDTYTDTHGQQVQHGPYLVPSVFPLTAAHTWAVKQASIRQ